MAGCWPVHCSWRAQEAFKAGARYSFGREAVVCELPAYRGTRRGYYSGSLLNAGQASRVDHPLKHICLVQANALTTSSCASPFEAAVYGTDTACEILVYDVLEASHAHKAGKGPLIWKLPDALHKVLIACLVIGHHPAAIHAESNSCSTSERLRYVYQTGKACRSAARRAPPLGFSCGMDSA